LTSDLEHGCAQIQEEEVQDIINHLDGAGINTINSDGKFPFKSQGGYTINT
jgi:hypothetical protein